MTAHFPLIEPDKAHLETALVASLEAFAHDSAGVLARGVQAGLYDRVDWLRATRDHIWPDSPFVVACARQGADALWLPLRDCGKARARSFASWYTLAFAPLATPGCPADLRADLLAAIAKRLRSRFGAITLWPLEPEISAELQAAFRRAGWLAIERIEAAHWVAHTRGEDFDAYWARRASKLRNTVRRRTKNSAVAVEIYETFDADAWAAYETVYASSWKPAEGSPAFLRAFAEQEGAAGTLRLGIARRDGRPVAAQFWTVENGIATIHKLAHLESEREHSPGTLLSYAMFRHVLDQDRPDLLDYGNGDEPYKAEWMDERRERYRLRLFDLRSLSGIAAWMAAVGKAARSRFGR
ncbi:GNAT family N-acetyltransferase [Sphingomonas sp. ST-64]|uniref:GNAT family N-acetyltransferase n=1 Tax=Sphingomonas plantiphila TaxID=3163295 RepID=A0ABW8YHL9_9SPHN